ncbi:MAG: nucleotide exchange factor GrpE [Halomonas sp.]|uniref:nucleotide exchange factor GrpE n=1 Tax=Halomonas sp. TaxID=1486246 RepID=UPI002ACE4622|nr:nucleotide exchange factor GrpE [Halomonas sp.]MDZ7852213.1 nucleotide exchange factor GrpE [Halomonas sp.]
MDSTTQEHLLSRFRDYLDSVESREADGATQPDAAAEAPDLFSLFTALEALKNEVKLESRQVKAALDQFRELFDALEGEKQRLQAQLDRQAEQQQAQEAAEQRDLLVEMLELRDRMHAGYRQAHDHRPGWLARRDGSQRFIDGMAQGMKMNLGRLDTLLKRQSVHPIETLGQPFDPHTMQAVDVAREPQQPDGIVLGERRSGYWHDTRLLRSAEVVVNKHSEER